MALSEELVFRGYILTRLYGLVKSVYVDMLIAALLFVLMHFPYRMAAYQMSFVEFITNVDRISDLFITGLWLSYIRIRTNSLYGAILPHWMSDLAYDIVTHI
ncbi:MAG: CPBP family intramembrane metalloprotease [Blautia sp.]|nr:CPBP family intramembrane metalloprotease [Blautia sp.]